jgi:hypothetical protein
MGALSSTTDIRFELDLPAWALGALNDLPTHLPSVDARMAAVIEFACRNVRERSGGPFASGIFERDAGRLVVIGVNRVEASRCSSAHAEVMAFSIAQRILGTWDLGCARPAGAPDGEQLAPMGDVPRCDGVVRRALPRRGWRWPRA